MDRRKRKKWQMRARTRARERERERKGEKGRERERKRDRNDENEGSSWHSQEGLTVIYVAVGSLASCLIKVAQRPSCKTAYVKILTAVLSCTLFYIGFHPPFSLCYEGYSVGVLSIQANPDTKPTEVFETHY